MNREKLWHKPGELLRESRDRSLTSDELLEIKSGNFYLSVIFLEKLKGPKEQNKKRAAGVALNLLREYDTIEDSLHKRRDKIDLMDRLQYCVSEVARRGPEEDIEDLVNNGDLKKITEEVLRGVSNKEERVFVEHFGMGVVLREMRGLERRVQESINSCMSKMIVGMKNFLKVEELTLESELQTYCYYVAGSIGEFFTELVNITDKQNLNSQKAKYFGEFLQLTNIIADIKKDSSEGRIYFPSLLCPSNLKGKKLVTSKEPEAGRARSLIFKDMISLVKNNFTYSIEYVASIPNELSGYKAFCLVPFIAASETIKRMSRAGAKRVFAGNKSAIRLPYGLSTIGEFTEAIVKPENNKLDNWLSSYLDNPDNFSFEPKHYSRWSREWIDV
ncbi:MAG: squalene/phytoene synthase family protein [Nanoarchaeota archaeon]